MKHNQQLGNFKLPEAELDEHFHYKISRGRKIDDFCRIRLYALGGDRPVCVLTELKNSGMSVTNAIEFIVPQACDAYNLGSNTLFIEHYDCDSYYGHDEPPTFDAINLNPSRSTWRRLNSDELLRRVLGKKILTQKPPYKFFLPFKCSAVAG